MKRRISGAVLEQIRIFSNLATDKKSRCTPETISAIDHYRAFLKDGSVSHSDLVVRVRAWLAALAG
jgi:hypothetical protein